MKLVNVDRVQVYRAVVDTIKRKSDKEKWSVELKKYMPRRTLKQNSYFHKLCQLLAQYDGSDPDLIKDGIKEKYGYKVETPLGNLVPKPSHLCDIGDEMHALIRGCVIEGADRGCDTSQWEIDYKAIKEKENETTRNQVHGG